MIYLAGPGHGGPGMGANTYLEGTCSELDDILNKKSGLLGISGLSGDMREILAAIENDHERAKLAFDIYVHRLQAGIGSMIAVLGGVDALVFTAGVGENSPEVRAAVCEKFAFLDLNLDPRKNGNVSPDVDISAPDSAVRALVFRAQEDWMIAGACWNLASTATPGLRR